MQTQMLLVFWNLLFTTGATVVKPRVYEIHNVNSSCTSQAMKVRLEFNRNFLGVVYAKGFPLEKHCRNFGTGEPFVEISIDASACGVRLISINDENFTFRISLNVQTDKFLQQINDLEVSAECSLSFNDMIYPRQATYNRQIGRTGRNKMTEEERANEFISSIRTWMEIKGTTESRDENKVAVGEQTVVLIKSFLPENTSATVTDCYAYDGTRDVVQKLIDERGCPLDEAIMPSMEVIRYEEDDEDNDDFSAENEITWEAGKDSLRKKNFSIEDSAFQKAGKEPVTLQVIGTTFSAFKFPDTSNLHLRCSLHICRAKCPVVSCYSNSSAAQERFGKSVKSDIPPGMALDKIEVFNSVEVVAPGIDSDGYSAREDGAESRSSATKSYFCLSASKMAFSFAILGAVFLCGVLAALWTVMRNHLRRTNKMDGSEQILVVRDSPMNFAGPRSEMHHNWTYS